MAEEVATARLLRFGVFELDLQSGELRKSGKRVRLAPQPFRLLVLLAGKPGQLVTREEIEQEIWGDNTVVDYEQGLRFLVKKTRAALGDHSESPRYIETLPRRGYRFIAPVETVAPGTDWENAPAKATPRWRNRLWLIGAGLVATVALLAALNLGGLRDRISGKVPSHVKSIAVLPLENLSHHPGQEYFADGMTEELISKLSRIGGLRVIARTSVMVYKGSNKPIREIARELNVDAVMEGSVLRSGNRVRIDERLVDGSTERVLWSQTYDRDLENILALYSSVAGDVSGEISAALTPQEQGHLASTRPVKPRAYEAYLRGLHSWNKRTGEDMRKGLHYFEQAVEIDPRYAPAYAGITVSYVMLASYGPVPSATAYPRAKAAALKAVALDDSLAEAHHALSQVHYNYDWDWPAAERESRRAIELNPGYAEAHHGYGHLLLCMGRHDEALAEMKKARDLDPLSAPINDSVGIALFFRGDYDLAIKQWRSTLNSNPAFWIARRYLGRGYLAKGLHEEALREFKSAVDASKGNPLALAWLGYGYAVSGETAKAREILATLQQKAKKGYISPYQFALVHAGLGERDQAIEYLDRAFQERYIRMVRLNQRQDFPSLRSDPRFQAIVRRMNFPQQSDAATP